MTRRQIVASLFLMAAWFLIGFFVRGLNILPVFPVDTELALIREAGQAISSQAYGGPPSARHLTYASIRGMLASLNDPYVEFLDPQTAARFNLEFQGSDAVIGLAGEMQNGLYVVTGVVPDRPADLAGVQEGDVLIEIDGWQVTPDAAESAVVAMIRGPVDSVAHLVVRRDGETLTLDVPRAPAVDITTRILDSNVAYLRLDRFTTQTGTQMTEALESLMAGNPKAIIWDLRFNGGGSMDATRETLDLFLDEGIAFYARLRDGTLIPYATNSGDIGEEIPLVVLIGHESFSAPETAAAAIKDRQRGILIGETTHGKGSIITTINLADGSAIRFTVARWLSPLEQKDYEGQGVAADIIVAGHVAAGEDPVLQAAVDYVDQLEP